MKRIQKIADQMFLAMLKCNRIGKPSIVRILGFPYYSLTQALEISGDEVVIALHRGHYVSSYSMYSKKDFEKPQIISREKALALIFCGKTEEIFENEVFKNRLFYEFKGRIDCEDQDTYLKAIGKTIEEFEKIIKKASPLGDLLIPISEMSRLKLIPEKVTGPIEGLLMV